MEYESFAPPPDLAGLVRCAWSLSGTGTGSAADRAEAAEPAFPDGSPELIFSFGDPFEHVARDGVARVQPTAFLVGQITGPMTVRPTGAVDLLAVRFEAHGASVLHRPMCDVTDGWLTAGDLSGAAAGGLHDRLASAGRAGDRIPLLWDALRELMQYAELPDSRVAAAVAAIRASHGDLVLDDLTRSLGVTPRTLQRLFLRDVGVGPKLLARIARFQRVFTRWRAGSSPLVRVAMECGYSDQSHLARDFRDFAGVSPSGFLASPPEFSSHFLHG